MKSSLEELVTNISKATGKTFIEISKEIGYSGSYLTTLISKINANSVSEPKNLRSTIMLRYGNVLDQAKNEAETSKNIKEIEAESRPIELGTAISFIVASSIRTEAAIEALTDIVAELRAGEKKKKTIDNVFSEVDLKKSEVAKFLFQSYGK